MLLTMGPTTMLAIENNQCLCSLLESYKKDYLKIKDINELCLHNFINEVYLNPE